MDDQPLISIIIPCFCSQNTIERCLNSIKKQSYENYEIIIIDDNSTDNTCFLIENMKFKEVRMRKNDENFGAPFCRNLGINMAKGSIVVFIDSDDWIDSHYLENLAQSLIENNSDLVVARLTRHSKEKISKEGLALPERLSKKEFVKCLLTRTITPVCYGKAFKREFLVTNSLLFVDYRFGEDIDFIYRFAQYDPIISCIDNAEYHVVDTQGSICNTHDDRIVVLVDVNDNIRNYLIKMDLYKEFNNLYKAYYAGTILNMVDYAVRFNDMSLVEKIIKLTRNRNRWYKISRKDSLKRKVACCIFKWDVKLYALIRGITLRKRST